MATRKIKHLISGKIKHLVSGPGSVFFLILALLSALAMLSAAAQQSSTFEKYYSVLLVINVASLFFLASLIIINLVQLFYRYRAKKLGARLTLRLLIMFVTIAILPISGVYYFSIQLINKGIDSWFNVQIDQALDDALLLGRTALQTSQDDFVSKTKSSADQLAFAESKFATIQMLENLRAQHEINEMTLYSHSGQIIASSSAETSTLVPDRPDPAVMQSLREGKIHSSLEPSGGEGLQMRVLVPVLSSNINTPVKILQTIDQLPLRYSKLGDSVESASREYKNLVYLRQPQKFSFSLTLTLITLVTTLIAVWLAIFSSRRLTAPLRDLAAATRAVSEGSYDKKLPVTSGDDFGVLSESFNNMVFKIQEAQLFANKSREETETQRTYLQTVLAHLSSGVLSFNGQHQLKTTNTTAQQILGIDLKIELNKTISEIVIGHPNFRPFFKSLLDAMITESQEWQMESVINSDRGRQILICRGSRLPGDSINSSGYVIVFDDVTTLIQAQRDAAWGEVARRLAHEIKNPLTPIQLSAERIKRKFMGKLNDKDSAAIDRATRTITQQVESMKSMVDAFASYAQPANMNPTPIEMNKFLLDVIDVHQHDKKHLKISIQIEDDLPNLTADSNRLTQVLNNIILNARDALKLVANPELLIEVKRGQGDLEPYIEFSFIDNGPGFPKELMDRLFEPYVTTKEKGTGLGLAIVKKIIEEHRGSLFAENLATGGAKLIIRIPCFFQQVQLTDPGIRVKTAPLSKEFSQ